MALINSGVGANFITRYFLARIKRKVVYLENIKVKKINSKPLIIYRDIILRVRVHDDLGKI